MATEEERKAAFELLVIENAKLTRKVLELEDVLRVNTLALQRIEETNTKYRQKREKELRPLLYKQIKEEIQIDVLDALAKHFGVDRYGW